MNYRNTWNLATIPEDKLKSEWGRRNGLKGGRKIQPAPDKATEEARRKQREYRRQRRAEGKDQKPRAIVARMDCRVIKSGGG